MRSLVQRRVRHRHRARLRPEPARAGQADREQLIQAVLNIARNAAQVGAQERIDFQHPSACARSTILRQRYRLALELQVIDDGPGVPEEIRDRIFNPLVSGQGRRHRLGTLARADVRPVSPGRHRVRVPARPHNIQDPAAADMKPVWIVDDDRSIRWVIEKALSREGIAFNSFSSAQEALDALAGGAPEVLVSDIRMPGQSGLELLQTVKSAIPAVPVIIMTAYSDLDSAVAAFQGGAYEYLPKPFDVDQAVELIRRALDESRRETRGHRAARARPRKSSARRRRCRRCSAPSAGSRSRARRC